MLRVQSAAHGKGAEQGCGGGHEGRAPFRRGVVDVDAPAAAHRELPLAHGGLRRPHHIVDLRAEILGVVQRDDSAAAGAESVREPSGGGPASVTGSGSARGVAVCPPRPATPPACAPAGELEWDEFKAVLAQLKLKLIAATRPEVTTREAPYTAAKVRGSIIRS